MNEIKTTRRSRTDTVLSGLDVLAQSNFSPIKGRKVGLLVNQASVNKNLSHAEDLFFESKEFKLVSLFGPQHGIRGTTQDNMIEWQGFSDPRLSLPAHSLYGEHRKPTPGMLAGIDTLVIDLPDVGARYYTFVWTAKLCLEACAESGIEVVIMDRPNPIGGALMEGPILSDDYRSFVGLSPVATRHGLTIGELMNMVNVEEKIGCKLTVIKAEGWRRSSWFDETALPWVLPSPNMPTLDTATVYPGGCLLEATNISEGRGTTRPFELLGAPSINPHQLIDYVKRFELPGLFLRAAYFDPTFHKHHGKVCGGVQVHVTDRYRFKPVLTYAALIYAIKALHPNEFQWKQPPYEYEYDKMPIDILWGDSTFREAVDGGKDFGAVRERIARDGKAFAARREEFLFYE